VLGGPVGDGVRVLLVSEGEMLRIESIERWEVLLDGRG
jgi:hypothetical protein